jgi:hypothetical protein
LPGTKPSDDRSNVWIRSSGDVDIETLTEVKWDTEVVSSAFARASRIHCLIAENSLINSPPAAVCWYVAMDDQLALDQLLFYFPSACASFL